MVRGLLARRHGQLLIPAMPASAAARARQASPASSASAALLRFGRVAAMGTVAVLILIAGVWASWGTAQHVLLTKGRKQGTVEVTRCGAGTCSGPLPVSAGLRQARSGLSSRTRWPWRRVDVRGGGGSGGDEVVRSGPAGVLYAWVPLGGALLLVLVVVVGRAAAAAGGVGDGGRGSCC
ncbi:hypothetical protein STENM327S_06620 [Streptomyces tendae]